MNGVLQGIGLAVIGVLLFALIIFIHEFGHFFAAKLFHVRVNEFSLGMGPKLFSFTRGETVYALRLLPIGGYCAMEGEDEESDDPHAFGRQPAWQRIIVVAAGGIMNILLAIVLMACLLMGDDLLGTPQIAKFADGGSAFETAGILPGDVITSVNGYAIYTDQDLNFALAVAALDAEGETLPMDVTVKRGDEKLEFPAVPVRLMRDEDGTGHVVLDIYVLGVKKTAFNLIPKAFADTVSNVRMIYATLYGMVTGRFGFGDLAGPVGTAQAVTQVAAAGLESGFGDAVKNIVYIMQIIAVNLGIVNLLPLPALDGGRILFLLIELIFRRRVPPKYEGWVHAGGLVLLLLLMAAVTVQDIARIVTGHPLA